MIFCHSLALDLTPGFSDKDGRQDGIATCLHAILFTKSISTKKKNYKSAISNVGKCGCMWISVKTQKKLQPCRDEEEMTAEERTREVGGFMV